jgi:serine/threonine-protein kinase HipA
MNANEINVLKLTLHGSLVGYLVGYQNGRNVLSFADTFKSDINRPTFSLTTHTRFPLAQQIMQEPWVSHHKLHASLSNLLPEGSLRELVAQGLKVHTDNEFQILAYLGEDLPGALVVKPVEPEDVPHSILAIHGNAKPVQVIKATQQNKFSLAGVQMKFSMKQQDGRYNLSTDNVLGDWIIKTPSTKHKAVPANEYTAMSLAALVGVEVPEFKLVELEKLDNLPQINLPNEKLAFAIKRFDRNSNERIHMEDFSQVLVKQPNQKYNSANYEQIGKILYQYSGDGLADAQQFARRLLVNILLANGDAHLKNWSVIYTDKITPRLSPAYDILTTNVYIDGERQYALNLGKNKDWYKATLSNFEAWADKSNIPWRAIKPHLDDVMAKAKALWPAALSELPMSDEHKLKLTEHWQNLSGDFKIGD